MATISSKKIAEALKKAQNIGLIEEPVEIMGCSIVLRSLRPKEYEDCLKNIAEVPDEGPEYANAFKAEHIARALIELNGVDLRDVSLVEADVEEFDKTTKQIVTKVKNLEKHTFIRDHVLATWGSEAMDVLFRKFNDVVQKSEKATRDGIQFVVPDESPEERYRRLLSEARELEAGIPIQQASKIRQDIGLLTSAEQQTTKEDFDKGSEALAKVSEEVERPSAPEQPLARPATPIPGYVPPTSEELLDRAPPPPPRQPLNQRPVDVPVPVPQAQVVQPPIQQQVAPILPPTQAGMRKSQQIAEMEGLGGMTPAVQGGTQIAGTLPSKGEVTELNRPQEKVNPQAAERIFEQPPVAGINPRFRKPTF